MTPIAYDLDGTPITYADAADFTRDFLDEAHLPFVVGELIYRAGRTLEAVDPLAFRMAVLDEIDHRITEGYWTEEAPADVEAVAR